MIEEEVGGFFVIYLMGGPAQHFCQIGLRRKSFVRRYADTPSISIEHEPESFDPTEDIKASYATLKRWLA